MPAHNRREFVTALGALGLALAGEGCSGGYSAIAPLPPARQAPAAVRTFGVSLTNGEYDPAVDLPLLLYTGASIARIPFAWDDIEIAPRQYFWGYYDAVIPPLAAAGITPLLITGTVNPIYGSTPPIGSAALAACAEFYAVAAARYPNVAWELGNEPNLGYFWPPAPNAAQYAAFCKAVAPSLRQSARYIISGGTDGIDLGFITSYLAHGVGDVVDYVGFHPYGVPPSQMASMLATLRANSPKPLFSTEYGVSGIDASVDLSAMANACGGQGVPFIWFELNDGPGNIIDQYNEFGLYTTQRQPKPTLVAAQAYASGH